MKKIYINPVLYIQFILIGYVVYRHVDKIATTKTYVNIAQQVATYVFTLILFIFLYSTTKKIFKPNPLNYDKNEVKIHRYFKDSVVIKYKDIVNVEYYNRFSMLEIYTKDKKYKFSHLQNTSELIDILKKKVKHNNL